MCQKLSIVFSLLIFSFNSYAGVIYLEGFSEENKSTILGNIKDMSCSNADGSFRLLKAENLELNGRVTLNGFELTFDQLSSGISFKLKGLESIKKPKIGLYEGEDRILFSAKVLVSSEDISNDFYQTYVICSNY